MGFPPLASAFVNAVHDTEKAKVFDQQMQAKSVAMGTLDETQVSGLIALALVQARKANAAYSDKQKQSTRDLLQQALLDYIDDLNRDIANLEAGFEAQFGDAWREQIALRILSPDDIPQQRPGESIEDYRKRLEKQLMEELLNPDGTIKDQYKNDPEMRKYAQWAQKSYNRNAAQAIANDLKNPATTNEQAQQIIDKLEEARNSEQTLYTADELEGHDRQQSSVLSVSDKSADKDTLQDQSSFSQSFLNAPVQ